ncbi:LysR family transcriptional regulator [Puniceibacterium sp. IMCC21224]|uniref:LysR family transcriptional regulator n=1 Tax=Puniceibacterium sp. IMCC21224 TaxID=1618204 RepID=UPI00064DBC22|nr:LysR family transcriptional regulator [Puniceibacterium sp. IMCC21224]KMK67460.1 transcriptional regulator, LysR family [Puniceibacterium sp. IMCC21224]
MSLARRLLPPLSSLRALEALDRLGSAIAVADELNLSQSAVSRQLQTLEDHLGTALLIREKRKLRLTPEARDYAATLRAALSSIANASLALRLAPRGGDLSLAILPSFGMRWLVPRLPDFARRFPEVTINLTTRLRPFNFGSEPFDAAIHFGENWPGTDRLLLMREKVLPVCAPALLPNGRAEVADLARLPLLHIQTRPVAWRQWFVAQGHDPGHLPGTTFDQFTTIIQGALHGLGVALMPDYLVASECASGALVPATNAPLHSLGAYHLVWPTDCPANPALDKFRDWLALQTEEEDALPR